MPGVGSATDSASATAISSQNRAEDLKNQTKIDQSQLDAQQQQQFEKMGQQAASQQMYQDIQAQAMRLQSNSTAAGPEQLQNVGEAKMARHVANQVMKQLQEAMGMLSMTSNPNAQTQEEQQQPEAMSNSSNSSGGGQRMGSMGSNMMSDFDDQANNRIQDAAKVAVYKDIADMMNGMNDRLKTKQAIGDSINTYNQLLANKWEGKKNMPVYDVDSNGQVKMVGKKAMTYEEAQAERDRLKDNKDSISELGQQDMLMLQQLMEKKNQLESMISNCMKANSDTQNNLAQALKA